MSGLTSNFSWQYPTNTDPANVAADMQTLATAIDTSLGGAWTAYTPTWAASGTAVALGNGTIVSRYRRTGKTMAYEGQLTMGATTTYGTGTYTITVPFAALSTVYSGGGYVIDASTATNNIALGTGLATTTTLRFLATGGQAGQTVPFTWASGDQLNWNITLELA